MKSEYYKLATIIKIFAAIILLLILIVVVLVLWRKIKKSCSKWCRKSRGPRRSRRPIYTGEEGPPSAIQLRVITNTTFETDNQDDFDEEISQE